MRFEEALLGGIQKQAIMEWESRHKQIGIFCASGPSAHPRQATAKTMILLLKYFCEIFDDTIFTNFFFSFLVFALEWLTDIEKVCWENKIKSDAISTIPLRSPSNEGEKEVVLNPTREAEMGEKPPEELNIDFVNKKFYLLEKWLEICFAVANKRLKSIPCYRDYHFYVFTGCVWLLCAVNRAREFIRGKSEMASINCT